jgi:hypothetical protein
MHPFTARFHTLLANMLFTTFYTRFQYLGKVITESPAHSVLFTVNEINQKDYDGQYFSIRKKVGNLISEGKKKQPQDCLMAVNISFFNY